MFQCHHAVLWTGTVQSDTCLYRVSNGRADKQKIIVVLAYSDDSPHVAS